MTLIILGVPVLLGCVSPSQDFITEPISPNINSVTAEIIPQIDGAIEYLEWEDAPAYEANLEWCDLSINPTGGYTNTVVLIKNTGSDLYLAMRYDDPTWDATVSGTDMVDMDSVNVSC